MKEIQDFDPDVCVICKEPFNSEDTGTCLISLYPSDESDNVVYRGLSHPKCHFEKSMEIPLREDLHKIYHDIMINHLDGLSVNDGLRILSDLIFNCIVQESKSKEDFKNKLEIYHNKVSNIYDSYLEVFKENLRWNR